MADLALAASMYRRMIFNHQVVAGFLVDKQKEMDDIVFILKCPHDNISAAADRREGVFQFSDIC